MSDLREDLYVSASDYDALAAQLKEAKEDCRNLIWLIENGERVFGSLWREASAGDVLAAIAAEDKP